MRRWKGEPNKQTIQSAPDLALCNPFPFNIVFEIKYFDKGGAEKAATELVILGAGIRGQPIFYAWLLIPFEAVEIVPDRVVHMVFAGAHEAIAGRFATGIESKMRE